jgi:MraZ protein
MVFYGEYEVSFSAPGRIVLPKKVREQLTGTSFVLTRGFDSCLSGYDQVLWEQKAGEVGSASTLLEQQDMKKKRFIFSSAAIVEIDEQGRFVIPKNLLAYAKLDKKVTIAGVGDHFELWNSEQWKKETA